MVIVEGSITAVLQINKQIDLLKAGITNDEIARGAAQSIAAVDKDIAFALLGGVARPGYVPQEKQSTQYSDRAGEIWRASYAWECHENNEA